MNNNKPEKTMHKTIERICLYDLEGNIEKSINYLSQLKDKYKEKYTDIRISVEVDVYPGIHYSNGDLYLELQGIKKY